MEKVDLNAVAYWWFCINCEQENIENSIPRDGNAIGDVKCVKCKTEFRVDNYYHNFRE